MVARTFAAEILPRNPLFLIFAANMKGLGDARLPAVEWAEMFLATHWHGVLDFLTKTVCAKSTVPVFPFSRLGPGAESTGKDLPPMIDTTTSATKCSILEKSLFSSNDISAFS
jgi:hypothetical protein